jgi:signal transduction histidine kinase
MKIQTRLKIGAFVPILFGCLILIAWFLTLHTLDDAALQEQRAAEVVKGVFELNILAFEYAQHPGERPHFQWDRRSASLERMLSQMSLDHYDNTTDRTIRRLSEGLENTANLFDSLSEAPPEEGAKEKVLESQPKRVAGERIMSHLLALSEQMVQDARQLTDAASTRQAKVDRNASTVMVAFVLTLAVAVTLLAFQLRRVFDASLLRLRSGLDTIASGELTRRIEVTGDNEFSSLSSSFNEMAARLHESRKQLEDELLARSAAQEQLRSLNETLEEKVAIRTAIAEQRAEQLRFLASELTLAEHRERRRIAEIVHDHLGQLLVAAKMKASSLAINTAGSLKEQAQQLEVLLTRAIGSSRKLMVDLSPPILYSLGLEAAVAEYVEQLCRSGHLRVRLRADEEHDQYPEDLRVLMFQAIRELLFNVVKHADTDEAEVQITRLERCLQVTVRDEGVGFVPASLAQGPADHFGLFSIRERLELLGGSLAIDSVPGRGTRVTMLAPIHPA